MANILKLKIPTVGKEVEQMTDTMLYKARGFVLLDWTIFQVSQRC